MEAVEIHITCPMRSAGYTLGTTDLIKRLLELLLSQQSVV